MVKAAIWGILHNRRVQLVENSRIDYKVKLTIRAANGLPIVFRSSTDHIQRANVTGGLPRMVDFID